MRSSENRFYSYIYIVPVVLIYFIFFAVPTIQGVYYSFTYWDYFNAEFAGLQNYINIITDPDISISIRNTMIFAITTTFFKVVLGLLLALVFNRPLKTKMFMRSVFFMPCIISNVAVGLVFSSILHPEGLLNSFLRSIGLGLLSKDWLTDISMVIFSLAFIEIWKFTGFTMVIFMAGLQTVPAEYYEAAVVDGVNSFQKFRHITLPLIMPTFNNALILNIIGGLRVFDIVYSVTGGGPGNASEVLGSYTFKMFGMGRYGEACAASFIVAILVVLISMVSYTFLRKKEVET